MGQSLGHLGQGDAPEIEALAAGDYGRGHLMGLGGSEDKDGVAGGLLQGLEKGVEGLGGEHVYFVYDVDLVAGFIGDKVHLIPQVSDLVNAPVAGGIYLYEVKAAPLGNRAAHEATVAGLAKACVLLAVYGLGQYTCGAGLASAPGSTEQVGVGEPPGGKGVQEGAGNVFLADQLGETLGTPPAVEYGSHKRGSCPLASPKGGPWQGCSLLRPYAATLPGIA